MKKIEHSKIINCYHIRTSSRIKLLGTILNNFFQTEENSKIRHENHQFFYLTNSEGMSILEINKTDQSYRIASYNDFDGLRPVPRTHLAFLEGLLHTIRSST